MLVNLLVMASTDAQVIRDLRDRLGITQAEFADLIGYSTSIVSLWERGAHMPSKQARILIERAVPYSVEWPKEKP